MAKHRLMHNFADSRTVRFFGPAGQLWHTGRMGPPIARTHQRINVGDTWKPEDE
jgi:hypothetical protein